MYYEEKIINEVLCWRGTPTGAWIQKTPEQLTAMLIKAKEETATALKDACVPL